MPLTLTITITLTVRGKNRVWNELVLSFQLQILAVFTKLEGLATIFQPLWAISFLRASPLGMKWLLWVAKIVAHLANMQYYILVLEADMHKFSKQACKMYSFTKNDSFSQNLFFLFPPSLQCTVQAKKQHLYLLHLKYYQFKRYISLNHHFHFPLSV